MTIFYSPSQNIFFDGALKEAYIQGAGWPLDAISVSDELFTEFIQQPPAGKMRAPGEGGEPCWIDIPPRTKAELILVADIEKSNYLSIAKEAIEPLSDAVDFDEATPEEIEKLKQWKKYRLALTRIDTSTAPDIEWPVPPL